VGWAIIRGMNLRWGSLKTVTDPIAETPGSLVEAIVLFAYLLMWSLTMAALIGVFLLTGVISLPLVLVWLPCFLWSKVSPRSKFRRSGHGPKGRPIP
jgi:Na+/serine symporter